MKKKIVILILLFVGIIYSPLIVTALEDYTSFSYTLNDTNNTITFTKYNGSNESVTIPGIVTINNKNYQVILNGNIFQNNTTIKHVIFENGIRSGNSLRRMFRGCTSLESIDFKNFDTSNSTDMFEMFYGCSKLKELDLSSFNTYNVTNMGSMFLNDYELENLNVLSFNTEKVELFSYMFDNCWALKVLDISSFNTPSATRMHYMFYGLTSLEYLNMSNLDTRNVEWLYSAFWYDALPKINKVVVGNNFRIQNNFGNSFNRGTWVREEDGKHYDAVDIPFLDNPAGTYTKLSDTIEGLSSIKPTTYRVSNNITKIDSFKTDNSEKFELVDNKNVIIKDLSVVDTDNYEIPGSCELIFKDAVSDADNNKFDLYLKLSNVHIYDMNVDEGYSNYLADILQIKNYGDTSGIHLYNYFYKNIDDLRGNTGLIYKNSSIFQDVEMKVLDSNGQAVEGTALFSIYDLDGASARDSNSEYLTPDGQKGYGDFSEGVTLYEGFDFSTLWMHDHTFLIQPRDGRITGSRSDNFSELSEFLIHFNTTGSKFTWNGTGNVGSAIFFRYQPEIVHFDCLNENGKQISGVKLAVYNEKNELISELITDDNGKNILLNPGKYILRQIESINGYEKIKDFEFYVKTTNGDMPNENNKIKVIAPFQLTDNPKTNRIILLICIIIFGVTGYCFLKKKLIKK